MFDVIIFVGEVSTLGLVYEFLALQFVSFIALLFVQGDVFLLSTIVHHSTSPLFTII